MEHDSKVNLARTDIALANIQTEYEQQLLVLQQQSRAELENRAAQQHLLIQRTGKRGHRTHG
jgi:hypothetical protein